MLATKCLLSKAQTPFSVHYLVIAGGGAGSSDGGGGGAGGYRTTWGTGTDGSGGYSGGDSSLRSTLTFNPGTTYTITVGGGSTVNSNAQGSPSSITGSDITNVTTVGGGSGGEGANNNGQTGGSGGGAGYSTGSNYNGGAGTSNEGFDGGDTTTSGSPYPTSGGGGAGQAGAGHSTSIGGEGLQSTIVEKATAVWRGGGGTGGAVNHNSYSANQASSGGGYGGKVNGDANKGAGGSGQGSGGSGVVILRMPRANYDLLSSVGGSPTVSYENNDDGVENAILQFTSVGSVTVGA